MKYYTPILIFVSSLVLYYLFNAYQALGFGRVFYDHYPGPCRVVEGIQFGAEKIVVLPNGVAVMTSGYQMKGFHNTNAIEDPGLYVFDFKEPSKNVSKLKFSSNYHTEKIIPHGLNFYENPATGQITLYMVNHRPDGDVIELFDLNLEKLEVTFKKAFKHNLLFNINDVVIVGENKFYATSDSYIVKLPYKLLEFITFRKWGRVLLVHNDDVRVVADGLHIANGIERAKDGKYLYVANGMEKEIIVYEIQENDELRYLDRIDVGSHVDNIVIDSDSGHLWIGTQPILYRATVLDKSDPLKSASQVLRVSHDPTKKGREAVSIVSVFADNGDVIMFSSSVAHWKSKLLIGSVMERLVYCEITTPYEAKVIQDRWNMT